MCDVRERATMHKGRVVLERLHKGRLHRIFEQNRHRTVCFDVPAVNGRTVAAVRDNDVTKTLLQVVQVARKAKDRHDFGRNRNVKTCFTWEPICHTTQGGGDLTQSAVVHVEHAAPSDTGGCGRM